ncbi:MAG: hypothetical protein ABI417_08955 [Coleofasciculaceae cyanobacterium]
MSIIWRPEFGQEIGGVEEIEDCFQLFLPVTCTNDEHQKCSNLNAIGEAFFREPTQLALEKYMDALSDEGVDACWWIDKALWNIEQQFCDYP